jgi:hypothetical protein
MGINTEPLADSGPDAVGGIGLQFERVGLVLVKGGKRIDCERFRFCLLQQLLFGGSVTGDQQFVFRVRSGLFLIASRKKQGAKREDAYMSMYRFIIIQNRILGC